MLATTQWFNYPEHTPEPNKDLHIIDSEGYEGYAYLCGCCKKEWRCVVSGGGLAIDVIKWRYCDDTEKYSTEQMKEKMIIGQKVRIDDILFS